MPLILRVDVDKPYGHSTIINKIKSKLSEDYWFPKFGPWHKNYLYHLEDFIQTCNKNSIPGLFYFRICTSPDAKIKKILQEGGHKPGVHAENTRDISTFKNELQHLKKISGLEFETFTKHGSGNLKLGKHHYAPYEPEKYLSWTDELNLQFPFGNEICSDKNDFKNQKNFYPKMFWLEREYRDPNFFDIEDLIEVAKNDIVPVLIHPCNFVTSEIVRNDFMNLIKLSKQAGIEWILI